MHLSPTAIEDAIRLLEQRQALAAWRNTGDDQPAVR
jgi:hypothetical protein